MEINTQVYVIERGPPGNYEYLETPFTGWTPDLNKAKFFIHHKEAYDHIQLLPGKTEPKVKIRTINLRPLYYN